MTRGVKNGEKGYPLSRQDRQDKGKKVGGDRQGIRQILSEFQDIGLQRIGGGRGRRGSGKNYFRQKDQENQREITSKKEMPPGSNGHTMEEFDEET